MVTPLAKLWQASAEAWRPRERLSLADWCARELRLPPETGPNPGKVDFDRFPFCRGILDAADDPETEEIVMTGATQWGKTTVLQAIGVGLIATRPAPEMLCAPDADATKKLRNKLYGMCDVTPALADKVPPHHKRNMSEIDLGSSICHLAWTGNPQRVAAESCRVVLVTEVDRAYNAMHEGALHKLISERVKAWFDFLKVFEGTPTDENSVIINLYEQSDKCRFLVPCPHCGHYQVLRFFAHKEGPYAGKGGVGGLRDENDNWLTADEVREKAFYICEQGCRIEQHEKDAMVRQGVWVPEGCKVGTDGAVTGTPKRSKRRRGFGELSSLYADTISIGRMAAEYIDSRDDQESLRNFINNWCGLRWIPPTKTPKGHELWRRLRGNHRRGKVPAGALFLTVGVDVQDDCTYWVVRAWGEGGTSWLVDWGRCPKITDEEGKTRPDSHLTQLRGLVIEKDWPLIGENPVGHETLRPLKVGVDCGHNPLEVHNFVRRFHSDLVLTVAGDAAPPKGQKYSFSVVEKNTRTGKPYPGGLKRWALNTDFYKMDLIDRWLSPLDEGGAWWVTDSPWDEIQTYMRQITNEGRETVKTRTGHTKTQWRILAGNIGNHYWDCEVYARALADMVVGGKWENLTARFRGAKEQRQEREKAKKEPKPGFVRTKSGGSFVRR